MPGCIELGIKEQFTQSFKAAGSWFHDAPRVLSPTFSKAMAAKPVCSSDPPLQLEGHCTGMLAVAVASWELY